jgi:cyclic pyranopterin phosphate synthase
MPEQGLPFMPHREILTYEEILHLVNLCIQQGIRKVRLTGGEPWSEGGSSISWKDFAESKGWMKLLLPPTGFFLRILRVRSGIVESVVST